MRSCGAVGFEYDHLPTFHEAVEESFTAVYCASLSQDGNYAVEFLRTLAERYRPPRNHEIVLAEVPLKFKIPLDEELVEIDLREFVDNAWQNRTWQVVAGTDFGGRTSAHGREIVGDYFVSALREKDSGVFKSLHAWPMSYTTRATFHSLEEFSLLLFLEENGIGYFKPPAQRCSRFLPDSPLKEVLLKLEREKLWVDVILLTPEPCIVELVSLGTDLAYDIRWAEKQNSLTALVENNLSFGFLAISAEKRGRKWLRIAGEVPPVLRAYVAENE